MVYVPAGVAGGTLTSPVAGSSTGTGPPLGEVAGAVTRPVIFAGSTGAPSRVSLSYTLPSEGAPVLPSVAGGRSSTATITRNATTAVTVAVSHTVALGAARHTR